MQNTIATKDPVCGMDVNPGIAAGHSEYKGQTYYFCSKSCKAKFDANPEPYVETTDHATSDKCCPHCHCAPKIELAVTEPSHRAGMTYVCPMHPEVVQSGPGDCPKCGMALESLTPPA